MSEEKTYEVSAFVKVQVEADSPDMAIIDFKGAINNAFEMEGEYGDIAAIEISSEYATGAELDEPPNVENIPDYDEE